MSLLKDLTELINAGVIDQDTADRIERFYQHKQNSSGNKLFTVFAIFGAILIGLGIILIIAHNWDELPRVTKTTFAFLPLITGQLICGYTLLKKLESTAWREGSATFLFFSIGASIALVSQIYHLPGELDSFVLSWMILGLPLIYVMNSSVASLLFWTGITFYACESSYWSYPLSDANWYWLLICFALPHYYLLYKKRPSGNFITFHHWMVPLSLTITLGTISKNVPELMFVAYFNLYGLFIHLGTSRLVSQEKLRNNGYKIIGSFGTVIMLMTLSFDWFWNDLVELNRPFTEWVLSLEFLVSAILFLMTSLFIYHRSKEKSLSTLKPDHVIFLLFILVFISGQFLSIGMVLINLIVLAYGVLSMRDGTQKNHLGLLNYGLIVVASLVICRFFDGQLSFVIRGVMFVLVGISFFVANYWMLKRRRING